VGPISFGVLRLSCLMTMGVMAQTGAFEQSATVSRIVGLHYPRLANLAGVQGSVVLIADIAVSGGVQSIRVVSGHQLLVETAKQSLQKWKFHCLDTPNACQARVTFTFRLSDEICDQPMCPSELEIDLPNIVTVEAKRLRAFID